MRRLSCLVVLQLGILVPSVVAAQVRDLPLRGGDRILVKIWIDSVFADTSRVQNNGSVVLPRLGTISIANLPASGIGDSVRRAYAARIREATIEVTPLRKVTVFGEVRRPAIYYIDPESSLRDAVAMAGGINEMGVLGHITLLRDSTRVRVAGWQHRSDDSAAVRSGDILIVDRESWFKRNAFTVVSGVSVLLSIILTLSQR